jgi:predicted phosphoadenosine phosphosulfate sulfurtransferase
MHEIIHAEIYRKLLSVVGQPSIPWTKATIDALADDFPGLYDYFTRYWLNVPPNQNVSDEQHELMAQHYRNTISTMVMEFDNTLSQSTADALSWVGLIGSGSIDITTGLPEDATMAWSNLPQSQRLTIINNIVNFNRNSDECE